MSENLNSIHAEIVNERNARTAAARLFEDMAKNNAGTARYTRQISTLKGAIEGMDTALRIIEKAQRVQEAQTETARVGSSYADEFYARNY